MGKNDWRLPGKGTSQPGCPSRIRQKTKYKENLTFSSAGTHTYIALFTLSTGNLRISPVTCIPMEKLLNWFLTYHSESIYWNYRLLFFENCSGMQVRHGKKLTFNKQINHTGFRDSV
jgi:hypothetical protein